MGEVDRAKATWSLHYQLLHLELGREYRYTSALQFRTSLGLSMTYQVQDFSTLYVIPPFDLSFNQASISSTEQLNFNSKLKQDVFGTGLRLAFAPKWYLVKWFGFQGKAGISYLWMYYELKRRDSVGANIILDGNFAGVKAWLANIKSKPRAMKLFFDINLGIFFETPTFCNQYRFNFFMGWESHIWVNETMHINLSDELSRFDLTLQGLTARLRLDF